MPHQVGRPQSLHIAGREPRRDFAQAGRRPTSVIHRQPVIHMSDLIDNTHPSCEDSTSQNLAECQKCKKKRKKLSGTVVSERPKQREPIDHRLSHLGGSSQDNDDEVWMAQQGPTLRRGQPGLCMSEVTALPSKHVLYSLCNICRSFPELQRSFQSSLQHHIYCWRHIVALW